MRRTGAAEAPSSVPYVVSAPQLPRLPSASHNRKDGRHYPHFKDEETRWRLPIYQEVPTAGLQACRYLSCRPDGDINSSSHGSGSVFSEGGPG